MTLRWFFAAAGLAAAASGAAQDSPDATMPVDPAAAAVPADVVPEAIPDPAAAGTGAGDDAARAAAVASATLEAEVEAGTGEDAETLALDGSLADLKADVLAAAADMLRVEQDVIYPDYARVSVYVGVQIRGFLLERASVSIDDGAPVAYDYSATEGRALLQKGLHRIVRASVRPGPHRLRAEFSGRFADAKPDQPPVSGSIETLFEKGLNGLDLVLPVAREARGANPVLREMQRIEALLPGERPRDAAVGAQVHNPGARGYRPGSDADPRLGAARMLTLDGRHFSAIAELLALAAESPEPGKLPAEYRWLLAESYLNFGMRGKAEGIYRELAVTATDHLLLNRSRLRLAELSYDRGYYAESTALLMRMREKLPQPLLIEWQDLLSRTLMAQGRHNEAVEVLTELENTDKHTPFMRYNLGVALINDGRTGQGRAIMDRVGKMPVYTEDQLALRDKANLSLGYHFLSGQLGGTAKPLFERVRVNGPFSNRALLGMGWSELAPRGERQPRVEIGDEPQDLIPYNTFSTLGVLIRPGFFEPDIYRRLGLRPFRLGKIDKDQEDALLRALVPWVELYQRDKMDPAVQEAMLAIPYALDRLGAHQQALQFYGRAIQNFEEGRRHLDEAQASIDQAVMVNTIVKRDLDAESGWTWRLHDLPDVPETYWLAPMIAGNEFQEALKNYRDAHLLSRIIDSWMLRVDELRAEAPTWDPPEIAPEPLIVRARRPWLPDDQPPVPLRAETDLGVGFGSDAGLPRRPGIVLALSGTPELFDGPWERLQRSRLRLDVMRPRLAESRTAQAALLKRIALRELGGQRKALERYMLEARFAIARLYDRQANGDDDEDNGAAPEKPK